MATNKHKLRQFQWFEMETRVRQMVQQLITPFTKRIFETISGINALKITTSEQATKLEQLRKIVTDDPGGRELNIFKEIDQKQEHLKVNLCQLQNKVSETQKIVDTRIKIQDQKLESNKQIVLNNMKLKQRISEEIFEQNESIKQLRTEIQTIVSDIRSTLDATIKNQEDDAKTNRSVTQKLSERIHVLEDYNKIAEEKFDKNVKEHLQLHNRIVHLEEVTTQTNRELKTMQSNLVYIKRLGNYVQELQQKIEKQNFALQHLSPLVTQAQLSQTLYSILPTKLKKRLVVYEYEKFSQLNNHILQTDPKKPNQVFNGMAMLEGVQKRNAKQIIDMKRKKLISMGIDIDNLNYQLKQKYYKEVSLTEDELDEEREVKVSNGPDSNEIANTINKMIELASADLSMKINSQMADSKRYLSEIEDQLQLNLQNSIALMDNYSSTVEKFKVEQQLVNREFQEEIDLLNEYKENAIRNDENISSSLSTVMQFCTLINHLQVQDQLDKQSISLFGLKQHFAEEHSTEAAEESKKRSVVNLQKECFSCNGYPASTISAFKMACLAYTPSSIVLENKQYKREELLEIATRILQHLKKQLEPLKLTKSQMQDTIKKKAYTQPSMQQGVINMSPPKVTINRFNKFNSTMTSQIRTKTKSKALKTEQSRRGSNAALLTNVFSQARKRHSIHVDKRFQHF